MTTHSGSIPIALVDHALLERGKERKATKRNGNCQFLAIVVQLIVLGFVFGSGNDDDAAAAELRHLVFLFFQVPENKAYYFDLLGYTEEKWNEFMTELEKSGRWRHVNADAVTAAAAAAASVRRRATATAAEMRCYGGRHTCPQS